MRIRQPPWGNIPSSEITSEADFHNRRRVIKSIGLAALSMASGSVRGNPDDSPNDTTPGRSLYQSNAGIMGPEWLESRLAGTTAGAYSTNEQATPYEYVTGYNNFYEFGTDKTDPRENSSRFVTDPWSVEIAGEAEITGNFSLEDILKPHDLEERVYRLRCVEAWSMVVPWIGFPLADLIRRLKPTSDAKYVRFETLFDPKQMPGQKSQFATLNYPYVEGLRIDEAMNELAFMASSAPV